MSYIDLINAFWDKQEEANFTPTEISLYFFLLRISNGLGWKNPFGSSDPKLMAALGVGRTALTTAKNTLKQFGLIDYRAGRGRRQTTQYLLSDVEITEECDWISAQIHVPKSVPKQTVLGGNVESEQKSVLKQTLFQTESKQFSKHNPNTFLNTNHTTSLDIDKTKTRDNNKSALSENEKCTSPDPQIGFDFENEKQTEPVSDPPKPPPEGKEKKVAPKKRKVFRPPSVEDVKTVFSEKGLTDGEAVSEAERFVNYYEACGWTVGKKKMVSWKSAAANWMKNYRDWAKPAQKKEPAYDTRGSTREEYTNQAW